MFLKIWVSSFEKVHASQVIFCWDVPFIRTLLVLLECLIHINFNAMTKLIANSEIVQGTRTAMGGSISKPFGSLTIFLELVIEEWTESIHRFFMLIISCLLVKVNSLLEIFFYLNAILIEICYLVERFIARLRGILFLSKTHSFSIEFHRYLYMIRDILMLFIFITETHLV